MPDGSVPCAYGCKSVPTAVIGVLEAACQPQGFAQRGDKGCLAAPEAHHGALLDGPPGQQYTDDAPARDVHRAHGQDEVREMQP